MEHILFVEPLGNALLAPNNARRCRCRGLGDLAVFEDATVLQFLSYGDVALLGRLSRTSRAFYAFANHAESWKALALGHGAETLPLRSTWRETCRALQPAGEGPPLKPLRRTGGAVVYSDTLYQPYLVAAQPIAAEWLAVDTIEHVSGLTPEEFTARYDVPAKPVVLKDVTGGWSCMHEWTERRLLDQFGSVPFHAGGAEVKLRDYWKYAEAASDDTPLIIFDKRFEQKVPAMARAYSLPPHFSEDLFDVLGGDGRPDNRWLIIGGAKSGSSWHVDPNGTSAFNATILGHKKWLMLPPGVTPPGVHPSADGLELAAPISLMEWFVSFYNHALEGPVRPLETVVGPGEVMFIPRGWWHAVLNLDMTVAITSNFISRAGLDHALTYLLNKPWLASGVPAELRHGLGTRLAAALRRSRPDVAPVVDACESVAAAGHVEGRSTQRRKLARSEEGRRKRKQPEAVRATEGFAFGFAIDEPKLLMRRGTTLF